MKRSASGQTKKLRILISEIRPSKLKQAKLQLKRNSTKDSKLLTLIAMMSSALMNGMSSLRDTKSVERQEEKSSQRKKTTSLSYSGRFATGSERKNQMKRKESLWLKSRQPSYTVENTSKSR